ncbi:MAG TPA: hypothetical protein VFE58_13380 [Tepidisphaeraceae bacterium]|jgi:hypothetical protein|nr:hypothetical protein [Tepidisphaeraceae bacterium]
MGRSAIRSGIVAAGLILVGNSSTLLAAVSATVVPGTLVQGSVQASLGAGTTYNNEGSNLRDWPLDTGGTATNKYAISLTNANFNGNSFGGSLNSILAFGNGGGVTLKFDSPIHPVDGQKEFGIFTAQMIIASSGAIFSGNMEAAILVSDDGNSWYTLDGASVASPTTYVATSYKLNAPTMSYDYTTFAKGWTYGSPGTTPANLSALAVANYQTPMPDDSLFNGAGTNAQRLALKTDTSTADYDAVMGTSGGGNWFDISGSGLAEVNYIRLNGVNVGTGSFNGDRLDAVFANALAVPEPSVLGVIMMGVMLRRRR